MGMTMIEKILASHAGQASVKPGDIVMTKFDVLSILEITFGQPTSFMQAPKKIHNPDQVAVVFDHLVPASTVSDANAGQRARAFGQKFGIKNFFDIGRHGIDHFLLPEEGVALPGMLVSCSDSHTASMGAYNVGAIGFGPAPLKYAVCKGETWFKVCPTILINFVGQMPANVSGRDVFFKMANEIGSHLNHNFEFGGPGLKNLTIYDRQAIATQSVELGADFATFPFDEVTEAFYREHGVTKELHPVAPDADAQYAQTYTIDLSTVEPMVAIPPTIANHCKVARELKGTTIHQVYIGSCAGGSLEDIGRAAAVLKGRKLNPKVRMYVAPGSMQILKKSMELGYIQTLTDAGVVMVSPGCGACFGKQSGLIGDGERVISTTTRNPKGRMGSKEGEVFLASATTAAMAGVMGYIVDPRDFNA